MSTHQWGDICLTILAICLFNLLDCPRLEILTLLVGVACVLSERKGGMRQ